MNIYAICFMFKNDNFSVRHESDPLFRIEKKNEFLRPKMNGENSQ